MAQQHLERENKQWPEVVGKTYEEAEKVIKEYDPNLNVHKLPENSAVTMDLRMDRVRVFVNDAGIVVMPPNIG